MSSLPPVSTSPSFSTFSRCCCSSPLGLHPSGCRGPLAADSQPPYFTASQPSSWQHSHRQEIALAVSGISNTSTLHRPGRPSTLFTRSLSRALSLSPFPLCLSLSLPISPYTHLYCMSLFFCPSACLNGLISSLCVPVSVYFCLHKIVAFPCSLPCSLFSSTSLSQSLFILSSFPLILLFMVHREEGVVVNL